MPYAPRIASGDWALGRYVLLDGGAPLGIVTRMKMKFFSLLALAGALLAGGCVGTLDGHSKAGLPGSNHQFASRYERSIAQVSAATETVLARDGKVLGHDVINNVFHAKVNERDVFVKIQDVDGKVTQVTVQVRNSMVGDVDLASDIKTKIALQLAAQ